MENSEELYVFTRTLEDEKLLVVCNFSGQNTGFTIPEEFIGSPCLISNMENVYDTASMTLRPYEAFVLINK